MNYQSIYQSEVQKRLKPITGSQILTPEDILHLPELIQNYLHYVGATGKPKIQNSRVVFNGSMKRNLKSNWMPIESRQYNFIDEPSRFFYNRARMFGIPV